MFNLLKTYFTFTRSQQNGILVLVLLIVVLLVAPYLVPLFIKQPKVDFSAFQEEIEAFENQQNSNEAENAEPIESDIEDAKPAATSTAKTKLVELNSADSAQLDALKGIGTVLSKRIVKFRNVLGGFVTVEQLKEVYGLDSAWVNKMKPLLYVDTTLVVKIPINSISAEQLKIHPYFRKNIAQEICAYRDKHGAFSNVEDLRKVVNEDVFRKIRPYLQVE